MSKTHVVIFLFFAVLMAVLATNIHMPVRKDYVPYAAHYKVANRRFKSDNIQLIQYIHNGIRHYSMHEEAKIRASHVDSLTMCLYDKLENWKQKILTESGYDSSLSGSKISERKSRIIVNEYFVKRNVADSIHYLLYKTFKSLWPTLRENDRKVIEDFLYDGCWHGVIGTKQNDTLRLFRDDHMYTATDNWCKTLFKNAEVPSAYASLSLLQYNLLATENTFLKMIYDGSHIAVDYFDSIACVVIPKQALILEGDVVRADALLFALGRANSDQHYTANQGVVTTVGPPYRSYGKWTNVAADPGINIVTGTAISITEEKTLVTPWSFSYFVAVPGVSLQLDNMHYCYRGIANPVNLSVPGYSKDKLSFRVSGATVKMIHPGSYEIWTTGDNTQELTVYIDATNSKGITTPVTRTKLKVKDVPHPLASVNRMNEFIHADKLKATGTLTIDPADSDFALNYKVVTYQLSILKSNKQLIGPIEGKDPFFNNEKEIQSAINAVERGDKLYITDIVVRTGKNNINLLPVVVSIR